MEKYDYGVRTLLCKLDVVAGSSDFSTRTRWAKKVGSNMTWDLGAMECRFDYHKKENLEL